MRIAILLLLLTVVIQEYLLYRANTRLDNYRDIVSALPVDYRTTGRMGKQ